MTHEQVHVFTVTDGRSLNHCAVGDDLGLLL
jgi:hypothetical protein